MGITVRVSLGAIRIVCPQGVKARQKISRYNHGIYTRSIERALNRAMNRFWPDYSDHFIEDENGETVFEYITNVPFLIARSESEPTIIYAQARQIDIFSGVFEIHGIGAPDDIDGEASLPPNLLERGEGGSRTAGVFTGSSK